MERATTISDIVIYDIAAFDIKLKTYLFSVTFSDFRLLF